MFMGTVHAASPGRMDTTEEGLVCCEWTLADGRTATVTFLDVGHVSLEATGQDGIQIRIRNSQRARMSTGIDRLVDHQLFDRRVAAGYAAADE